MKNQTIKYVIKVVPTFSQRLGFMIMSMVGGVVGTLIFASFVTKANQKKKQQDHDELKEYLKRMSDRVKKEEADKE